MNMAENDGLVGAGISPRERLERIETLLYDIDKKLDHKASQADLIAVALRVSVLEQAAAVLKEKTEGGESWRNEVRQAIRDVETKQSETSRKVAYATGVLAVVFVAVETVIRSGLIGG